MGGHDGERSDLSKHKDVKDWQGGEVCELKVSSDTFSGLSFFTVLLGKAQDSMSECVSDNKTQI